MFAKRVWPVPKSRNQQVPKDGTQGSFWEWRKDRYHCGVDIYGPRGSDVLAPDQGKVVEIGEFSSPQVLPYWNRTFYLIIQDNEGRFLKFAELEEVSVFEGSEVKAGQVIGKIGQILNPERIDSSSPSYIQELKESPSMLHFEICHAPFSRHALYLGGNWLGSEKPVALVDPTEYLESLLKNCDETETQEGQAPI